MPALRNRRSSTNASTSAPTGGANAASQESNAALASALNRPTLKQGARGPDVSALQEQLLATGYLRERPDGIFGSGTAGGLRMFQSAHGLDDDGVAGPKTNMALANPRVYRAIPVEESQNQSEGQAQAQQQEAAAPKDQRSWWDKLTGGGKDNDNNRGRDRSNTHGAKGAMKLDKLGISVPTRQFYASGVSPQALSTALTAYQNYSSSKRDAQSTRLTLVDYTKPRTEKRLWVLDLTTGQVLHKEFVAHGYGSSHKGNANYSSRFKQATKTGSGQSQLGLMKAKGANGRTGTSSRVRQANAAKRAGDTDGYEDRISTQRFSSLEKEANGKADVDVIMHWAHNSKGNTYATDKGGVGGNSAGCWALPEEGNGKVVDLDRKSVV